MAYSLVIKNGRVVDGTGRPGFVADIGVEGDRITMVGAIADPGDAELVDASGKVVAPGFIEIHTHYDPQICWDRTASPAGEHGVTTVVMGNCGLSLAPVRPGFHSRVTKMFNKIEDIDIRFFDEAVSYDWTSFPEYLDHIRPGLGVNIAPVVGHSILRHYVMGDAAQERAATDAEIAEMCRLLKEAIAAGAFGLSMSYPHLTDENDRSMASGFADRKEKIALARTLVESGRLYLQSTLHPINAAQRLKELDEMGEITRESGACGSVLAVLDMPYNEPGQCEAELAKLTELHQRGSRLYGQTMTRPLDTSFRMVKAHSLFYMARLWCDIMMKEVPERIELLSDRSIWPDLNRSIIDYVGDIDFLGQFTLMEAATEANQPFVGQTLRQIADAKGTTTTAAMLEIALSENLEPLFSNLGMHGNVDNVAAILDHPMVQMGSSDAGAHVAQFAGEGDATFMLRHFVRQHGKFTLERAIQRMTSDLARDFGIKGRGAILPGNFADLVLFDPDTVDRGPEILVRDLPGGGERYIRHATGIDKVFVNGQLFVDQGRYTDARAGRTV
jgi:N-acyl-D-aspartate/D-glutamate deacylase